MPWAELSALARVLHSNVKVNMVKPNNNIAPRSDLGGNGILSVHAEPSAVHIVTVKTTIAVDMIGAYK